LLRATQASPETTRHAISTFEQPLILHRRARGIPRPRTPPTRATFLRLCGGPAIITAIITATITTIITITAVATWATPAAMATVTSGRIIIIVIIIPTRICPTLFRALITAIIITHRQLLDVSMTTAGRFSTLYHSHSSDWNMPMIVATVTQLKAGHGQRPLDTLIRCSRCPNSIGISKIPIEVLHKAR